MGVVPHLAEQLASLREEGPPGRIILGCGAFYLLCGVVACARSPRARMPVLATLLALFGLGTLGGALAFVIRSRRAMVSAGLPEVDFPVPHPSLVSFGVAASTAEAGLLLLALTLLWTFLVGAVVTARHVAARRAEEPPPSMAVPSLLVMAGVVGGALFVRAFAMASAGGGGRHQPEAFQAVIAASSSGYRGTGAAVITAAVIALTVVAFLCLRAERGGAPGVSGTEKVASLALLVAGVLAFAVTRRHAGDAAAPVPFDPMIQFAAPVESARLESLPVVEPCREWTSADDGPWVELTPEAAKLDGWKQQPAELIDMLGVKWRLWAQLHPGEALPPVVLCAPRTAEPASFLSYLTVVRKVWPEAVVLAARRPVETWESRTLGVFPRRPRTCPVPVRWDDSGRSMSAMKSWDELVHEAAAAEGGAWRP